MPAKVRDDTFLVAARAAYYHPDEKSCGIWSSDTYCACLLGRYMRAAGMSEPRDVHKSRGYYWKVNDLTFKWLGHQEDFEKAHPERTFQRIY